METAWKVTTEAPGSCLTTFRLVVEPKAYETEDFFFFWSGKEGKTCGGRFEEEKELVWLTKG